MNDVITLAPCPASNIFRGMRDVIAYIVVAQLYCRRFATSLYVNSFLYISGSILSFPDVAGAVFVSWLT